MAASTTLAASCYKTLTSQPLNIPELENLPQHVLVQLLSQAAADRDAALSELESSTEQLNTLKAEKERRYIVDPPFVQDRVDEEMQSRVERVLRKWSPRRSAREFTAMDSYNNYCNVKKALVYDKPQGKFQLIDTSGFPFGMHMFNATARDTREDLYRVISSPLLLYRLCCLFGGLHVEVEGQPGYKVVWSAEVCHSATGEALGFSEWKAASLVRVSKLEAPQQFEEDMLELLDLLCDPLCPHPYDGTVAGSVA